MSDPITRKRDTGEPGNPGEFGTTERAASGLALGTDELNHTGKHELLAQAEGADSDEWPPEAPKGISPTELFDSIRDGAPWDSESVEIRDHWGPREWEEWADCAEDARLEDARNEPREFEGATAQMFTSETDGALVVQVDTAQVLPGRQVRVFLNDAAVYDGNPEQDGPATVVHQDPPARGGDLNEWRSAHEDTMSALHAAQAAAERSSVGVLVAGIEQDFPDAHYLSLEYDHERDRFASSALLDKDRQTVADIVALLQSKNAGDADALLLNVDVDANHPFIEHDYQRRNPRLNLDAAKSWLQEAGAK